MPKDDESRLPVICPPVFALSGRRYEHAIAMRFAMPRDHRHSRSWHFSDLTGSADHARSWGQSRHPRCAPGLLSLTRNGHRWEFRLRTLGPRQPGNKARKGPEICRPYRLPGETLASCNAGTAAPDAARAGRPDGSRARFDCNSTRSVKTSAWRRSSSAIIGGWLDIVEITVTRTPRR